MGQDDSCGICGKHYQECRHYMKLHIPGSKGQPLCNRHDVLAMTDNWRDCDIDPEDICRTCKKIYRVGTGFNITDLFT